MEQTTGILSDLIAFPTVSADSNLEMIAYLANRLEDCGARVDVMFDASGQKANLFATLGPETDGGIVLSGHSDVVPVTDQDWTSDPFAMVERDGRLYGRGTCDMKGFIAATLAMAPEFAAQISRRPIHFAFTYDEEVGCIGAGHLVQALRERELKPRLALIGEPTSMRVVEGHKGCHEYSTRFQGLEGHGSDPGRGVNAVEYAARYVNRLLDLRGDLQQRTPPDSRFDPPWTTLNIGALNGGSAHNVIASKAQVDWEMRPVQPSDADHVKDTMARYCRDTLLPAMQAIYPEASIETEVVGEVAGLTPTSQNEARELMADLLGSNAAELVPFGTEAGLFQALGLDVVVCGPGSIAQAHKADEYLSLDQLSDCLRMLERLGDQLAN
ncbi:acetylornithine deacetylase ArgE [Phaeobacter piscinae]|uniref:Acetylornithine deacetylase ArgE n=2 Tax=Phaeobacter piscinae TaxID=1580596 RepID=A0ABN5DD37_9RHOB|nr:acetylornithine deacetylase ArgE [Phaeobacter piscinae]ATG38829.1 acetylornithine deacetylase ArgE [Phaeobacter piscinae]AUQ85386.1 acetylornithine deacetylase ArgE [Phaeobacter piscinae]AUR23270.1 acetylornithine deacetylase ArgE [Phaeobacter piscinae]